MLSHLLYRMSTFVICGASSLLSFVPFITSAPFVLAVSMSGGANVIPFPGLGGALGRSPFKAYTLSRKIGRPMSGV